MARKRFSDYSKENQEVLLKTWSYGEIEAYVALSNAITCGKETLKVNGQYIREQHWLGISNDGKTYRCTNHTLYTLLTESGILPSSVDILKKDKLCQK